MLEESVRPYLAGKSGAVIVTHDMHVYGQGEGHVAALIDDLMNGANPTVATYAKDGEMFVRVAAKAADRETADALCAPVMEEVRRRVGSEYIYAVDIETLEETVVRKLLARGHENRHGGIVHGRPAGQADHRCRRFFRGV